MKKRILVTGSRDWADEVTIHRVLTDFGGGHDVTLVSGACPPRWIDGVYVKGADYICEQYAQSCDWQLELYPADWAQYGKRAGFIRNSHMVSLGADVCCAFIKDRSKGASMTAFIAEQAGIQVVRVEI